MGNYLDRQGLAWLLHIIRLLMSLTVQGSYPAFMSLFSLAKICK